MQRESDCDTERAQALHNRVNRRNPTVDPNGWIDKSTKSTEQFGRNSGKQEKNFANQGYVFGWFAAEVPGARAASAR